MTPKKDNLTVRQVIAKYRDQAKPMSDELAAILAADPPGVAFTDQLLAAEKDLFGRIEKVAVIETNMRLRKKWRPDQITSMLAFICLLVAISQRKVEWCPHASLDYTPRPVHVLLTIRWGGCERCYIEKYARVRGKVEDDGLCDFCQRPTSWFTPIMTQVGVIALSGEYCNDCASGWGQIIGRFS